VDGDPVKIRSIPENLPSYLSCRVVSRENMFNIIQEMIRCEQKIRNQNWVDVYIKHNFELLH
jgi:hypothetical protein